jgi:hypothetical protein
MQIRILVVTAGKQVAAVTFPDRGSGSTRLHVFALGIVS